MEQHDLKRISNEASEHLVGKSGAEFAQSYALLSPFAKQVAFLVADVMERVDRRSASQISRRSWPVLEKPEFAENDNVRHIVQIFEEQTVLEQVVNEYADSGDIHVVISGNGRIAELRDMSLVLALRRDRPCYRAVGRGRPAAHVVWSHHGSGAFCRRVDE